MRHPRFLRVPLLGVALLLAVALLSAACGGDDDDRGASPPASPSAASGTTPGGSASAAASVPAPFPVSVTDSGGTTVTFTEPPKRIISYSPGATEVLFAVGAGSQVVGLDKFSDYPPETSTKTRLEYSKPAPEPALALQPDLVIMATRQEGQVTQFRALGMTVLLLKEPADLAAVLGQVRALGKVTGHGAEGERVAAALRQRIDAVQKRLAGVTDGPLVFYEVSPELHTAGPETFIGSLLATAKAKNVAQGATTAFPQLSAETIISSNPAVILLADGGGSGGQSPATVMARPGWAGIVAVKNGRVHVIDSNLFNRPGPRVVDALEQLVGILYPDLK
ncbi:MAG: cobalamin-binding protein [Anaerolinea sp.]|nr:cobalamin-binding protein [Anaerolinea sp.]